MIINTDAGLKKFVADKKHNKAFLRASLCFYTSENELYFEKLDNFNLTHSVASTNTAELLASLSAFQRFYDKLEQIKMYTDCPLLPMAQKYYQSAQGNQYKDPLENIKEIILKHGLKKHLPIFVEAIKKARIEKVSGHSGLMENEYVDNVCSRVLNNKSPYSFDRFLRICSGSIFLKDNFESKKINLR